LAAELPVVRLKIRHPAARLTPPAVATQDLLPQTLVQHRMQPQAAWFWANRAHDAFSLRPSRNVCCCFPGRNLKNLVIENNERSAHHFLRPVRTST
jgi:hypothetical protein